MGIAIRCVPAALDSIHEYSLSSDLAVRLSPASPKNLPREHVPMGREDWSPRGNGHLASSRNRGLSCRPRVPCHDSRGARDSGDAHQLGGPAATVRIFTLASCTQRALERFTAESQCGAGFWKEMLGVFWSPAKSRGSPDDRSIRFESFDSAFASSDGPAQGPKRASGETSRFGRFRATDNSPVL